MALFELSLLSPSVYIVDANKTAPLPAHPQT